MRVCLITGEYPPDEGGVADYSACLAAALGDLGVQVSVLTGRPAPRGSPEAAEPPAGAEAAIGSAAERTPGSGTASPAVYRALPDWGWREVAALAGRLDRIRPHVIHFQYQAAAFGMGPAIHAAPAWLRRRRRARLALTFHDLRQPYLFPKAGPLRPAALRAMVRAAHLTIATNAEDYAELALQRPARARLELVPIGSNIPDRPPSDFRREAWRAAAGIPPDADLLLYFGFLNASKGGLDLVVLLEQLRAAGRDARLVMLGGTVGASDATNAAYLERFRAALAERGLDPFVHWTGHVPPEGVSAWLHGADLVVLPYADGASYRRGSLLAALSHGRPILSTLPAPLTGGLLPALEDGLALRLVPPGEPGPLVAAATEILTDPALAGRLAAGARALAAQFAWPGIAARHLTLYRELIEAQDLFGRG